ncbi:hypothetical protein WJX77_009949 [Trebouxia sp. C0004]
MSEAADGRKSIEQASQGSGTGPFTPAANPPGLGSKRSSTQTPRSFSKRPATHVGTFSAVKPYAIGRVLSCKVVNNHQSNKKSNSVEFASKEDGQAYHIFSQPVKDALTNLKTVCMGKLNESVACTHKGQCVKGFPKDFSEETMENIEGAPIYRSIKLGTAPARLIQQAALIAWDEAPMLNVRCYEAMDNTFRDIMGAVDPALKLLPLVASLLCLVETCAKSC